MKKDKEIKELKSEIYNVNIEKKELLYKLHDQEQKVDELGKS